MDVNIIRTDKCLLRPMTITDAGWLYKLFNDNDVVKYIEGVKLFNSDVETVKSFINSMQTNSRNKLGAIWCVEYYSKNIGFVLVYDLSQSPYISYALQSKYRGQGYMYECVLAIGKYIYDQIQLKISIKVDANNFSGVKFKDKIVNTPCFGQYFK